MRKSKVCGSVLMVAAVFFLLTFSREAHAGGIDVHIGMGFPIPGYVVVPPVAYPPPPPVVVVPAPYRYPRPVVLYPRGYHRPHHFQYKAWEKRDHWGHGKHRGRH